MFRKINNGHVAIHVTELFIKGVDLTTYILKFYHKIES